MIRFCIVDGCFEEPVIGGLLCATHYQEEAKLFIDELKGDDL